MWPMQNQIHCRYVMRYTFDMCRYLAVPGATGVYYRYRAGVAVHYYISE